MNFILDILPIPLAIAGWAMSYRIFQARGELRTPNARGWLALAGFGVSLAATGALIDVFFDPEGTLSTVVRVFRILGLVIVASPLVLGEVLGQRRRG